MTESEYRIATGRASARMLKAMRESTRARVAALGDMAVTDAEKRLAALLTEIVKN